MTGARRVNLVIIRAGVDLWTPAGRLLANVMASVAVYENEVRSERVLAGQAVARAADKRWGGSAKGRRLKVTPEQIATITRLNSEGTPIAAIARATGLSRPTVYTSLRRSGPQGGWRCSPTLAIIRDDETSRTIGCRTTQKLHRRLALVSDRSSSFECSSHRPPGGPKSLQQMLDEPQTKVPASWPETFKSLCVATFLALVVAGPIALWVFKGIAVVSNFDFPVPDDPPQQATVELPPELLYDARYWGEFPLYWHRSAPGSRDSDGADVFLFETPGGD